MKSNRLMWGIVSIVVLFTAAITFGSFDKHPAEIGVYLSEATPTITPTPEIKDTRDLSKYGSVEYEKAPEDLSAARVLANKRYDHQGNWVSSIANNPQVAGVGRIREEPPPPLFPVEESSLIVVGDIVGVKAFLSNDKGSVYSEFAIKVDEVLKNDSKARPKKVTADRDGGVVVYPNGQRIIYQDSDLGLQRIGIKYLFFLIKDDESPNYRIITSYDLSENRVRQVEMGRDFDEFKDSNKTSFLEIVRNKITGTRIQ